MKLYLSSIRIPAPKDLSRLLGKPLHDASIALIPNAEDYFSERARNFKVDEMVGYLQQLGREVAVVDLREYSSAEELKSKLAGYDLVWAMGGNTYMLRYEMQRSGFDRIIRDLLNGGVVYGGDSAGALVAGSSIAGVESADEPAFAEELIKDGMNLVPFVVMPHVDNPEFADVLPAAKKLHDNIIELKDSQAVIFDGDKHWVVGSAETEPQAPTHEHQTDAQLQARLTDAAQQVTVGARYMHYKQLNYRVVDLALREEDNEPCVVYQAEYGEGITWTRPVSSWIEDIEVDGKSVKRFTKIDS